MTRAAEAAARPQDPLDYEKRFWGRGRLVAGMDEVGRGPLAGPVVAAVVVLPEGTHIEGVDDSKRLTAAVRDELYPLILDRALAVGVGAASAREIDYVNILRATTKAMRRALARLEALGGRFRPPPVWDAPSPPAEPFDAPAPGDHGRAAGVAGGEDTGRVPEVPGCGDASEGDDHDRPEARGCVQLVVDGRAVQHLGWHHDAVVGGDGRIHSIGCASVVAKVVRDRLMCRLAHRYPGYGWDRNVGYGTPEHRAAIDELGLTAHHRQTFCGLQWELEL